MSVNTYSTSTSTLTPIAGVPVDIITEHTSKIAQHTSQIAQLNSSLSELQKHSIGSRVSIISYNSSSNKYTCPKDGYVSVIHKTDIAGIILRDSNGEALIMLSATNADGRYESTSLLVRKGMQVYVQNNVSATGNAVYFSPFN